MLEFEIGGTEAYLFHAVTSGVERVVEASQWTTFIKKVTLKYAAVELTPKTLRSIFITWLRASDATPEVYMRDLELSTLYTHVSPRLTRFFYNR